MHLFGLWGITTGIFLHFLPFFFLVKTIIQLIEKVIGCLINNECTCTASPLFYNPCCWDVSWRHRPLLIVTHVFFCYSEEQEEVNGSCEVKPPQSWCTMHLEDLYLVASIGSKCSVTVSQQDDQGINRTYKSASWSLSDVGKLKLRIPA